jgi:hypothetical protein
MSAEFDRVVDVTVCPLFISLPYPMGVLYYPLRPLRLAGG